MILKINCSSSSVNLAYTVFSNFLNMNDPVFSSTQGISATAFLCIACVTCFLKGPLHLEKSTIANIVQVLAQMIRKVERSKILSAQVKKF